MLSVADITRIFYVTELWIKWYSHIKTVADITRILYVTELSDQVVFSYKNCSGHHPDLLCDGTYNAKLIRT